MRCAYNTIEYHKKTKDCHQKRHDRKYAGRISSNFSYISLVIFDLATITDTRVVVKPKRYLPGFFNFFSFTNRPDILQQHSPNASSIFVFSIQRVRGLFPPTVYLVRLYINRIFDPCLFDLIKNNKCSVYPIIPFSVQISSSFVLAVTHGKAIIFLGIFRATLIVEKNPPSFREIMERWLVNSLRRVGVTLRHWYST